MRSSWLYFATRSERAGAPVLICPQFGGDREVGDRGVLGLAGAVAHHAAEAVAVREVDGVEGLGERADLVDLHQQRVGGLLADAAPEPLDVGDEQVVADELHLGRRASAVIDAQPVPVLLVERVLDGDDRVRRDEVGVVGDASAPSAWRRPRTGRRRRRRTPRRRRRGRARCRCPSREPGLLDRHGDQVERLAVVGQVGGEAALVAEAGREALAPSAPT